MFISEIKHELHKHLAWPQWLCSLHGTVFKK